VESLALEALSNKALDFSTESLNPITFSQLIDDLTHRSVKGVAVDVEDEKLRYVIPLW